MGDAGRSAARELACPKSKVSARFEF